MRAALLVGLTFLAAGATTPAHTQERNIIPDWPAPSMRQPQLYVPIYDANNPDEPLPQDALLEPNFVSILEAREDMQLALVAIDMGMGNDNPFWAMSQTALTVFLNKLATWDEIPVNDDKIWPYIPAPDPRYKGVTILLQTKVGKRFAPIKVFEGKLTGQDGASLGTDVGRRLEYWLFGTARVRRDQLLGSRLMPVFTFNQCRTLGQRIIETTPRQCLLADNNLLLETPELPTIESAQVTNFNNCLKQGEGLIYTFPRRCVTAGGRVFTEPPQVYETPIPADAPVKNRKAKRLAPNAVSATQKTSATLPLVVSPKAASSAASGLLDFSARSSTTTATTTATPAVATPARPAGGAGGSAVGTPTPRAE